MTFASPLRRGSSGGAGAQPVDVPLSDAELTVLRALRTWRQGAASRAGFVSPLMVTSDRSLRALARARPASGGDLRAVESFFDAKVALYGEGLLDVINRAAKLAGLTGGGMHSGGGVAGDGVGGGAGEEGEEEEEEEEE